MTVPETMFHLFRLHDTSHLSAALQVFPTARRVMLSEREASRRSWLSAQDDTERLEESGARRERRALECGSAELFCELRRFFVRDNTNSRRVETQLCATLLIGRFP